MHSLIYDRLADIHFLNGCIIKIKKKNMIIILYIKELHLKKRKRASFKKLKT